MARQRDPKAFGKARPAGSPRGVKARGQASRRSGGSQVIPDAVARRMARRIALATGLPTLLGMAVIVASYLLATRDIVTIEPVVTLLGSGAFFLLGLLQLLGLGLVGVLQVGVGGQGIVGNVGGDDRLRGSRGRGARAA